MRRYLAEFLSDPRVIPLPRLVWLPILHGIVLRTRPAKSAGKYQLIWTPHGSPLAVHTARQAELLRPLMKDCRVEYAMRYGEPSMAAGLEKLKACQPVTVVPLYPQYSVSATQSVLDLAPGLPAVREFHDHPSYIAALASTVRKYWQSNGRGEKLLMSFHGLPKKGSARYEAECRATARLLAERLDTEHLVTFQSRFGYAEWLGPYTEPTLKELAAAGIKRVDVACPGFVSDCLETLEEIGITARRAFHAAGGTEMNLVACLNDSAEWINALQQIARA